MVAPVGIWGIVSVRQFLERFRDESSKLCNLALAADVLHRPAIAHA
jgi:hypothetical protein